MNITGWLILFEAIQDHIDMYIFILGIVAIIYYIVIRKVYISFVDPLFIVLITEIFAVTVPIFILTENLVYNTENIIFCIVSSFALFFGIFSGRPNDKNIITVEYDFFQEKLINNLFWTCATLYVVIRMYSFIQYGIPILTQADHVTALLANGFITKITWAISPALMIISIDRLFKKKYASTLPIVIFFMINLFLSGSKSGGIALIQYLFLYELYLKKIGRRVSFNFKKTYIIMFIFAIIVALTTLAVSAQIADKDSDDTAAIKLITRIVGYGDGFAFSYLQGTDEVLIKNNDFFNVVLEPIAKIFRIIPEEDLSEGLGYQMTGFHPGTGNDSVPNVRHQLLGLIAFGKYGSVIFSYFLGRMVIFLTRTIYYRGVFNNLYMLIFYFSVLYLGVLSAITDPMYGLIELMLVGGCVLSFIMLILYNITKYINLP